MALLILQNQWTEVEGDASDDFLNLRPFFPTALSADQTGPSQSGCSTSTSEVLTGTHYKAFAVSCL